MPRSVRVGSLSAPALGEIRLLPAGSTVYLLRGAPKRQDWPRYVDAIASAVAHGVSVIWLEDA